MRRKIFTGYEVLAFIFMGIMMGISIGVGMAI